MKSKNSSEAAAALLRQKAEEKLKESQSNESLSEIQTLKLIHELQVHQIELEMQNDELILAKEQLEIAKEEFTNLFDFAPSGFIKLSKKAEILELNFCAANMLCKERSLLKNKKIGLYISVDTRSIFNTFFEKLYTNKRKETCEVTILTEGNLPIYINIEGIINQTDNSCLLTFVDNTERKQADEILKESESRFKNIFAKHNSIMLLIKPEDGQIINANNAASIFYGYSISELCAMSINQLNTLSPEKIAEERNNALFQKRNYFIFEHKLASDEIRIVEVHSSPIDFDGKQILFSIIHDITNRITAEQALKESEWKYRSLIENTSDVVFCTNEKGEYIFTNNVFAKTFGKTPDYFVGKTFWDIYPKEEADHRFISIKEMFRTGEVQTIEVSVPLPDKTLYFLAKANPIKDETGKVILNLTTSIDITDRKLAEQKIKVSEEKYRVLVENTDTGFVLIDEKGKVISANESYRKLAGFKINDDIIGRSITEWTAPEEKENNANAVSLCAKQGFITDFETIYEQSNGTRLNININASTYKSPEGFNQIISYCRDITQRKIAELELKKAKEKAEESDLLKSAFLANMSHEIRTPMNGILGFADLLKTSNLSGEKQQEYINLIEKSGKRMLNIINDIVNISKVESGMVEINISTSNANEQTDFIYNFFKLEAEKKGVKLILNNGLSPLEAQFKTDREKVFAILTNLVKNALKFTEKGSIEIGYVKKGEFLEFYVKDTGVGILLDKKELIFERFRQGSEDFSRGYEGAGLGLAISKAYVELLGGKIWAKSNINEGSIFYFTIPYNNELKENKNFNNTIAETEENIKIKNIKILLVEDDETAEQMITVMVKKYDKQIFIARDGEEAVISCYSNPEIDLILMDVKLPKMSGYEATKQIRAFNKDVIIIAQTAYAFSGEKEKAIEAGCNDYISKPYGKAALYELIEKYF